MNVARPKKLFTAEDIPRIVRIFEDADTDGTPGLDIDEFCEAMEKLNITLSKEELIVLHMKIDTNCDTTVDLEELLHYLLQKSQAAKEMNYKNQLFPKPFTRLPISGYKSIIGLVFIPFMDDTALHQTYLNEVAAVRPHLPGLYVSINMDGVMNVWNDYCDNPYKIEVDKVVSSLPHSHMKKIQVNDMVYIRELKQLVVSTLNRELLFYHFCDFPAICQVGHTLIVEERVGAMHYWSDGTEAIFAFGDTHGFLYIFISYDVKERNLFCTEVEEGTSPRGYPTYYVSSLLKHQSANFVCQKLPVFNDICSQIKYFPSLKSFAICGRSSKKMVLISRPEQPKLTMSKNVFRSRVNKKFFTCVEYSTSTGNLVTGGTDGFLRLWFPHKSTSCLQELHGHAAPITHIVFNPMDKICVTLAEDKNICVWSCDYWLCLQRLPFEVNKTSKISSFHYNIYNNEILLADMGVAKCTGRGTDVFRNMLTSHEKPLYGALYHSIYRLVISICRNGVATVWDVVNGNALMEFKITSRQHEDFIAMSFDQPRRRLLTATQGDKVRLWNFNNGSELAVLPVIVPKKVTGIVCINERVYVFQRNCKVIFDLDLNKQEDRILKHDYLDDICSADRHENTLITASSNGNIVIWKSETAETLYFLNTTKSPRTDIARSKDQGHVMTIENFQKNLRGTVKNCDKNIGPLIICLKTREVHFDTATLLTCKDGYIYAWSAFSKGGLLGKFKAINDDDDAVITIMSTDVSEQILLIGDNIGRIYLWDIKEFGFKRQADKGPFEDMQGWCVSLYSPPLLQSWRANITGVVSIMCDPTSSVVITAGLDCNVHQWTITGRLVGVFGKDIWQDNTKICPPENTVRDQEGRPSAEELGDLEMPIQESPSSSPPTSPLPDLADIREVSEGISEEALPPLSADIFASFLNDIQPTLNEYRDKMYLLDQNDQESTEQSHGEVQQVSEDVSTPTPTTDNTNVTSNVSHMQQSAGTVEQESEDTSKHVQRRETLKGNVLTPCPDQPCTPGTAQLTKGHTDSETDSSHAQLSASAVKQGSKDTSKRVHFPPTLDTEQLTHSRSQLKPHPPQTPRIKGGANIKQSSPSPHLKKTLAKYRRALRERETAKGNVITPCPLNILPDKPCIPGMAQLTKGHTDSVKDSSHMQLSASAVKQESEDTSKHVPPISDTEPHPPQTLRIKDGTNLNQSSLRSPALHSRKIGFIFECVPENLKGDTLKGNAPTTCPPDTPPDKQGSKQKPKHAHLSSTPDEAQLATGHTNVKSSLSHMQQSASAVKERSEDTSKRARFPPISDRVQLTCQGQFNDTKDGTDRKQSSPRTASPRLDKTRSRVERVSKNLQRDTIKGDDLTPGSPNTLSDKQGSVTKAKHVHFPDGAHITTDCTNATKNSSRMQKSASAVKRGSEDTSKRERFPPISDTVQPTRRGQCNEVKTKSKFGRTLKIQQRDTLEEKDNVLVPCPPNALPDEQDPPETPETTTNQDLPRSDYKLTPMDRALFDRFEKELKKKEEMKHEQANKNKVHSSGTCLPPCIQRGRKFRLNDDC